MPRMGEFRKSPKIIRVIRLFVKFVLEKLWVYFCNYNKRLPDL